MKSFRTLLQLTNHPGLISYSNTYFFAGSCFAESMERKMCDIGFSTVANPFGAIYNPFSLQNSVRKIKDNNDYSVQAVMASHGKFVSLDHHSKFSDSDPERLVLDLNSGIRQARIGIQQSEVAFLTLGIHGFFVWKENGSIVNNCHKIDSRKFERRFGSIAECTHALEIVVDDLVEINKDIRIVFTLSPVRYLGWGAAENSLGKAILRVAIDNIIKNRNHCSYFEAYEIMLDDLRDYRFYTEDMVHPSSTAIEYIWKCLLDIGMDKVEAPILEEMEALRKFLQHRSKDGILHEKGKSYLASVLDKIQTLASEGKKFGRIKEELLQHLV